jgi:hypothetical protein
MDKSFMRLGWCNKVGQAAETRESRFIGHHLFG